MSDREWHRIPMIQYEVFTEEGICEYQNMVFSKGTRVENGMESYIFIAGAFRESEEKKPFWQRKEPRVSWKEKPDSYAMEIGANGIYLESYTERGFFYGIRTLEKWNEQYQGRIPYINMLDWADVAIRCEYLEFRNFYPKLENVLRYLEDMADRHINAVLVEMEDKRPFVSQEFKKLQNKTCAFTPEEVKQLQKKAGELHIEWIPLQQSFGHLEYVLKYPEYAPLRELPQSAGELCPLKKESVALAEKLLKDISMLFADSKYLHMGCDEVWSILQCENCRNSGMTAAQILIRYVNQLADYVCSLGKTPLFWHDMLIDATVEELKELDQRVIVVVWMYDGNDLTQRASQFLEKLKEAGISVWGACAVRCWDKNGFQNYPLLQNRKNNIIQWAEVCKKYHLEGMVNTNWSAYSALAHPYGIYETSIYPATFAGAKSWNATTGEAEFLRDYFMFYHGIYLEGLQESGMKFEDYYQIAARLHREAKQTKIEWKQKEADWYQVVEEYENATQGDFPAVLQMFRVAKYRERPEEWDSMRQRYVSTFTKLQEIYPKMKMILRKYMDPQPADDYLFAKYYLWNLYEREILRMAKEAGQSGFYPILTKMPVSEGMEQ